MRLPVPGNKGMVPLGQIATVAEVKAPVQVTHVDGERTASITAAAVNNNIGAASAASTTAMDGVRLPAGAPGSWPAPPRRPTTSSARWASPC